MAPSYFNEIWHLETRATNDSAGTRQRIAHTQTTGEQFAKTALPLPVSFDFTMKNGFKEVQRFLAEREIKLQEAVAAKEAAKVASV